MAKQQVSFTLDLFSAIIQVVFSKSTCFVFGYNRLPEGEVGFRTRYGAAVIAVHRDGTRVQDHPGESNFISMLEWVD